MFSNQSQEKLITVERDSNGQEYKVWTKKMGKGNMQMLCLHGGPGANHAYLTFLDNHLKNANLTYYYYDQLGSGKSDKPNNKNLWRLERFVEEVETVRKNLGLDHFILFGQSWGGLLAIEYALKYQDHLQGLIISNMTASVPSYIKHVNELRQKLPKEIQEKLSKYEALNDYQNEEYQKIMMEEVYSKYLCRKQPMPDLVQNAFVEINQEVYETMQGPNEFVVNGNLKDWDRWQDIKLIDVPTLLSVGEYDTMSKDDIVKMSQIMPNATVSICPNGSHLSMCDDPEHYFQDLLAFLKKLELQNQAMETK